MTEPLRVGLVGAGPWAHLVHGPMLAAGPETELVGVWARRPEAAAQLAYKLGVPALPSFEAVLDASEAVAFAVPPAVQCEYAAQAARRGKALLLEKPIAESLEDSERLVDVIEEAGVTSMVTLTYRYAEGVRDFIASVKGTVFRGGRSLFLTNAYLGGPFATPWRLESGSILDIGPHAIDLLQATVGPVVAVKAAHGSRDWTAVTLEHDNGAITQVSLCSHCAADPIRVELDLFNEELTRALNVTTAMGPLYGEAILTGNRPLADAEAFDTLRAEFAGAVRGCTRHELDARYGLNLQKIVTTAIADIAAPGRTVLA